VIPVAGLVTKTNVTKLRVIVAIVSVASLSLNFERLCALM
jgi:hypothetical protein